MTAELRFVTRFQWQRPISNSRNIRPWDFQPFQLWYNKIRIKVYFSARTWCRIFSENPVPERSSTAADLALGHIKLINKMILSLTWQNSTCDIHRNLKWITTYVKNAMLIVDTFQTGTMFVHMTTTSIQVEITEISQFVSDIKCQSQYVLINHPNRSHLQLNRLSSIVERIQEWYISPEVFQALS